MGEATISLERVLLNDLFSHAVENRDHQVYDGLFDVLLFLPQQFVSRFLAQSDSSRTRELDTPRSVLEGLMHCRTLITTFAGVFAIGIVTPAAAQRPQPQLMNVTDIHVAPGKAPEFEMLLKNRNARMEKGKVSFRTLVAVSEEGGVYRQITLLGNNQWATRDKLQAQLDKMPEMRAPVKTPVEDIIVGIDQVVRRSRPDLAYNVDKPRVADNEIGFAHEIRLYLKVGANEKMDALIKRVAALRAKHNITDPFFVSQGVSGEGGPMLTVTAVARNVADFYMESEKIDKMIGAELEPILQEGAPLLRRVENENFTVRQDLAYQPPSE